MIETVKISDNFTYNVSTNVFVHTPTGYILHPDVILGLPFEEIVTRMFVSTRWWLLQEDYNKMKDYINNVEALYI